MELILYSIVLCSGIRLRSAPLGTPFGRLLERKWTGTTVRWQTLEHFFQFGRLCPSGGLECLALLMSKLGAVAS